MPTYEYECQACGHSFELYQQITARPTRVCPSCGERRVKRLIGTGAGVLFRGSGFYQTDYRSASYKKAAKAETAGGDSGKQDSGKQDSSKSNGSGESKSGGDGTAGSSK